MWLGFAMAHNDKNHSNTMSVWAKNSCVEEGNDLECESLSKAHILALHTHTHQGAGVVIVLYRYQTDLRGVVRRPDHWSRQISSLLYNLPTYSTSRQTRPDSLLALLKFIPRPGGLALAVCQLWLTVTRCTLVPLAARVRIVPFADAATRGLWRWTNVIVGLRYLK